MNKNNRLITYAELIEAEISGLRIRSMMRDLPTKEILHNNTRDSEGFLKGLVFEVSKTPSRILIHSVREMVTGIPRRTMAQLRLDWIFDGHGLNELVNHIDANIVPLQRHEVSTTELEDGVLSIHLESRARHVLPSIEFEHMVSPNVSGSISPVIKCIQADYRHVTITLIPRFCRVTEGTNDIMYNLMKVVAESYEKPQPNYTQVFHTGAYNHAKELAEEFNEDIDYVINRLRLPTACR